jgi:4a-hydroxytetrahydrobiopterin dehydratase
MIPVLSKAARDRLTALALLHCKPGAPRLAAAKLESELAALPGWTRVAKKIEKTFRFSNWYETIAFVNAVAWIADRQDHHPDLSVHYDHCDVAWSTHDAGGITQNDCICAAKVEQLVA